MTSFPFGGKHTSPLDGGSRVRSIKRDVSAGIGFLAEIAARPLRQALSANNRGSIVDHVTSPSVINMGASSAARRLADLEAAKPVTCS